MDEVLAVEEVLRSDLNLDASTGAVGAAKDSAASAALRRGHP